MERNRILTLLCAATLALAAAGCADEEQQTNTPDDEGGIVYADEEINIVPLDTDATRAQLMTYNGTDGTDALKNYYVYAHDGSQWLDQMGLNSGNGDAAAYYWRSFIGTRGWDSNWKLDTDPQRWPVKGTNRTVTFYGLANGYGINNHGLKKPDGNPADPWSESGATVLGNIAQSGGPHLYYKVPLDPINGQIDLLGSYKTVSYNASYPKQVGMEFNHLLSHLIVKVRKADVGPDALKVVGVTLLNLKTQGSLQLNLIPQGSGEEFDYEGSPLTLWQTSGVPEDYDEIDPKTLRAGDDLILTNDVEARAPIGTRAAGSSENVMSLSDNYRFMIMPQAFSTIAEMPGPSFSKGDAPTEGFCIQVRYQTAYTPSVDVYAWFQPTLSSDAAREHTFEIGTEYVVTCDLTYVEGMDYVEVENSTRAGTTKWALGNLGQTYLPNPWSSPAPPALWETSHQTHEYMGWLFQWGRGDYHEGTAHWNPEDCMTEGLWETYDGQLTGNDDTAAGTKFIQVDTENTNWGSWQSESSVWNPCPDGWRLPDQNELSTLWTAMQPGNGSHKNGWAYKTGSSTVPYLFLPSNPALLCNNTPWKWNDLQWDQDNDWCWTVLWSATWSGGAPVPMSLTFWQTEPSVTPEYGYNETSNAYPVRCVKEESVTLPARKR